MEVAIMHSSEYDEDRLISFKLGRAIFEAHDLDGYDLYAACRADEIENELGISDKVYLKSLLEWLGL